MYLTNEIVINKPPDEVFDYTHAAETLTVWYEVVKSVEVVDGSARWPEKDGQIKVRAEVAGLSMDMVCTATTSRPGQEMMFTMESKVISGSQQWIYTDQGDSTLVKGVWDYRLPLGAVGEKVYEALAGKGVSQLQQSMVKLKEAIESA